MNIIYLLKITEIKFIVSFCMLYQGIKFVLSKNSTRISQGRLQVQITNLSNIYYVSLDY